MKTVTSLGYISGIAALLLMVTGMSCTKAVDNGTPVPQPPPTITPPSGVIQTFVLNDTLIPFHTGSTAKWLVTGTNNQTVVTFNDVKVANYGVLDTGPLKVSTLYTLAVNNGNKASINLKVADSITTLLWGRGKSLKQTKAELSIISAGQTTPKWVDTTVTAQQASQRILFNLDGSSQVFQKTLLSVTPNVFGWFEVNTTQTGFNWQGTIYTIVLLDSNNLVVTFDSPQSNGSKLPSRNSYQFE